MALPPTLPTSFVPKQPVSSQVRRAHTANGVLYYIALFVMAVAVVGAAGTFGYKTYIDTVRDARKVRLDAAEKNINPTSVEEFIRLRNRIQAASGVLDSHIMISQFLDVLEGITLQNVRFQSLILTVAEDRTASIEMRGVARSFNALAAESAAFAKETRIRRAIFSGITPDKTGLVKFSLQAELLPKLITQTSTSKVQAAPNIATSTPFAPAPAATTTVATSSTASTSVKTGTATTTKP